MRLSEKLTNREAIVSVFSAIAYGALIYCLDNYVFPRCRIPFDVNSLLQLFVPMFVLLFLTMAAYLVIGRITWFGSHDRWRVAVSILTSLVTALLILLFLCKHQ